MLRVKEVATRLKVHPATVYRWIKDGHLEAVRYGKPHIVGAPADGPGGSIRVPESALTGFVEPEHSVPVARSNAA